MNIPATRKIALVGHSGCGKSTITNLLLRFYEISGGSIQIDGIDIKDYCVKSLREQIGFVMQEPILFKTSIKNNIKYGKLDATDEEVLIAAEAANALSFIESNVEDLTKGEKEEKMLRKFKETIVKKSEKYPGIAKLEQEFQKTDPKEIELMYLAVSKADPECLQLIARDPKLFVKQFDEDLAKTKSGTKWDDLLLHFEWNFEHEKILSTYDLTEKQKSALIQAVNNMRFCFGCNTIKRWLKTLELQERELPDYSKHL